MRVVLEPKNPRNIVYFDDKWKGDFERKPYVRLVAFQHHEGSKVYKNFFPTFVLPNGKSAHFYDSGVRVIDETQIAQTPPPPLPLTLHTALQVRRAAPTLPNPTVHVQSGNGRWRSDGARSF
eukprot:1192139-Prorocentrum_minimum.AAC.1